MVFIYYERIILRFISTEGTVILNLLQNIKEIDSIVTVSLIRKNDHRKYTNKLILRLPNTFICYNCLVRVKKSTLYYYMKMIILHSEQILNTG